jgi:cytochrome subunit of sulfide dehydrogenase
LSKSLPPEVLSYPLGHINRDRFEGVFMSYRNQRTAVSMATAAVAVVQLGVLCAAPSVQAQSTNDSSRYLVANCANCHGTNGATKVPGSMPLAGLKADYIVEQMRAFREGKRSATIMHQIAKGYSEEQVVAMAQYFAKQPKTP